MVLEIAMYQSPKTRDGSPQSYIKVVYDRSPLRKVGISMSDKNVAVLERHKVVQLAQNEEF